MYIMTSIISLEKYHTIKNNIMNRFEKSDTEYHFDRITDYAISQDEIVVVGTKQYLNFYDNHGNFLYSYWMQGVSGAYTLEYSDEDILIYRVRENDSFLICPDGSYLSVDSANHKEKSRLSQTMNQVDYQLNASLTELTATDKSGNTRIIYQMSQSAQQQDIFLTLLVIVIAILFIIKKKIF